MLLVGLLAGELALIGMACAVSQQGHPAADEGEGGGGGKKRGEGVWKMFVKN